MSLVQLKSARRTTMMHRIFSIRDTKAEFYYTPFAQKTHGEAERSFSDLASNEKTSIGQHPEDFDLYYLGEFDDQTGKFQPTDSPQHVVKAAHVVRAPASDMLHKVPNNTSEFISKQ